MNAIEDKLIQDYLSKKWEEVKDLPNTEKKNECHPQKLVYVHALFYYSKGHSYEEWIARIQQASDQMASYNIHDASWIETYNHNLAILYRDLGVLYDKVLEMSSHSQN